MSEQNSLVPANARTRSERERMRFAGGVLAVMAASYAGLAVWYFYADFFSFITETSPFLVDRSGVAVPASIDGSVWTVLSPWRVAISTLSIALLGLSSLALWRRDSFARLLSFVTLWGVVFPQVLWGTEFVVDWHAGAGMMSIVVGGAMLCAIPTMLLYEGSDTLKAWSPDCAARTRLFISAIGLSWLAFLATEFLDHSYQLRSDAAYLGALATVGLAVAAIYGIARLKVWALFAGVGAAASFVLIPTAFHWTQYMPSHGYIDQAVRSTTACGVTTVFVALLPLAVLTLLTAPYLREAARRTFYRE